jgi:putative heme-binding domain-containing protein
LQFAICNFRPRGVPRRSLYLALLVLFPVGNPTQAQPQSATNFFLPKNPVAAAYVLGRLSNQELIAAPRSEFVYVALLERKGLEPKYRLEALEGLATLRHTDALTELIAGFSDLDRKGEDAVESLGDLGRILLQHGPAELAAKRPALEWLATHSEFGLTRQIGYAALVTADGSLDPPWKDTGTNAVQLADLLLAVPLVRSADLRAAAYPKLEPLVRGEVQAEVRRAAITAIASVPGHEVETFGLLATLIQSGTERAAAILSLQRLPKKSWPQAAISPLAESLLVYLEKVPPAERTESDFLNALQLATDLASHLPEEQARTLTRSLRNLGPAIMVLRAVYEQLRYDKSLLVVEAGKPVAIILENEDAMPHNLAILAPGALEEIGLAAEKMPLEPDAQGRMYVPASPKVLYATKLVAPGQKTKLAFTAPSEPGEYPYVCTFPGHWRRMTGILAVVKDVEAYLATAARAQAPAYTEWKLEDLAPELPKVGFGRNLEGGQELFTKLACVQCHKLGPRGYAFGPDLTDVFTRYKQDRAAVLLQILEPSKVIEDRYRNFEFELNGGGDSVTGMILKEDAQTVTIQTGPADSLIQTLKKSEIQGRKPQTSSPMPLGLLNALSKEQILDLLAFLEAKGEIPTHRH